MKKKIIKNFKITFVCICLLSLLACTSGINKYDKAAKNSAKIALENEANDYTWTTVKTGKLEYRYVAYNEDLDKYQVYYFAKFDVADEPEDEFLEITVTLIGDDLLVADTECVYCTAMGYEMDKSISKPTVIHDADGDWKIID